MSNAQVNHAEHKKWLLGEMKTLEDRSWSRDFNWNPWDSKEDIARRGYQDGLEDVEKIVEADKYEF